MIAGRASVLHVKEAHPRTIHWVCKFRLFIDVRLYQFWDRFLAKSINLSMLTLAPHVAFKETIGLTTYLKRTLSIELLLYMVIQMF